MITRLFKPGDRVQKRSGGPVMIVQRYARKYSLLTDWHEDHNSVECTWLDSKEGYQRKCFLSRNLMRASTQNRTSRISN